MTLPLVLGFLLGLLLVFAGCYCTWEVCLEETRRGAKFAYVACSSVMTIAGIAFMAIFLWRMIQF